MPRATIWQWHEAELSASADSTRKLENVSVTRRMAEVTRLGIAMRFTILAN